MAKQFFTVPKWEILIPAVLILFGLYLSSLYSYLLFHSLSEIFSIVIAWSIFMIAWNSRQYLDHKYFLFLGIAYFFVGSLDLVHTLAYTGMGVFHGYDSNLPTQLWVSARFIESISLFSAPFFFKRNIKFVFWIYAAIFVIFLFLIFSHVFPDCFIEGTGLTLFKKISEYVIVLILTGAIITLSKRRGELDLNVYKLLTGSILLTICSEMSFTFYIQVYGFSNFIGHYLKIISFLFIYKAIVEKGFIRPYDLLFRDLKKNQNTLQESEKKFRLLYENAPLGYQSLDINGHFLEVNQEWLKLLGYKREEVIGKFFGDFLAPEWHDHFKENFFRAKAKGEVSGVEYEMVKKDNSSILVLFNGKVGYDDAGNFKQTHCILHEVTEQRCFEKALAESEEKYRSMMRILKDAVYICSQDLRIEYMNPAMMKRIGHDATGEICYQSLYGHDEKCSWCVLDQVQQGKNMDYELVDPKDNLYYHVINSPISYGNGSVAKLTIFHDITQQKLNQEALKRSAEQLRAFASRLTYMEEAEKKKLALELHDRVGQNLTAMNINLTIMNNLLSPLSADRIGDRLSDSMALTDRIFQQIRDVMADLRPEALDDYGLVAALGLYCEKFETRYNIRTQIRGNEFTPRLETQTETALFRIVQESMTNAARHARADRITLTFENTDTFARLTIADNGVGFDPAGLNRAGKSNGWGLTIMQERAFAMGVNFRIESGQGRGTKVIVEIKK